MSGLALHNFQRKERWGDGDRWAAGAELYEDARGRPIGVEGLYRLTREKPVYSVTVFFDREGQRLLRGDWYGLRFLARKTAGLSLRAVWSQPRGELFLPDAERWPLEYEMALVQASGLLPVRADRGRLLRYVEVPEELAEGLCERLGVTLSRANASRAAR